jgi:hypothetical protein
VTILFTFGVFLTRLASRAKLEIKEKLNENISRENKKDSATAFSRE